MDYFNTNKEVGEVLKESRQKASMQESVIMEIFQKENKLLSPEDVHDYYTDNTPLTSIRRAITNLTSKGKLIKTDKQKIGKYGKKISLWVVKLN